MSSLDQHESAKLVRILIASNNGTGKTGALACLVNAGFRLFVLDFDNGLSVLRRYVKPEFQSNVHYVTLKDRVGLRSAMVGVTKASAFQEAMDLLDNGKGWNVPGVGSVYTLGPGDILVIDTLSGAGKASMNMVLAANGASFKHPEIQHYGVAMGNLEGLLGMITDDEIKCSVIVNTHITQAEGSIDKLPMALGSKLPPKVGGFFDNMITLSITGGQRTFKTKKDGIFACKIAAEVPDVLPIEDGLLTIFRAITGKKNIPAELLTD